MKSKFYEGKKEIWISKEAHKLLRKDSIETEAPLGELASIAIISYYQKMAEVSTGEKSVQRFL